ncbi:MAG: CobW family GTP-binding protein [Sarcina sp.]
MKVDIISGFLGAGKTTLIQKLINEELYKEKIAIIENEYGEVAIDGTILSDSEIEVKEITSGCICCSIKGDFKDSIKEVIDKYKPDRIIIEPSGVAKLSEVISSIKEATIEGMVINMKITVVDANNYKYYSENFGEFYKNQLQGAGVVILNRTDGFSTLELDRICEEISKLNTKANIITTSLKDISAKRIMEIAKFPKEHLKQELQMFKGRNNLKSVNHSAQHIFENIGIETSRSFSKVTLNKLLEELTKSDVYGEVLRAKGIVAGDDGKWVQFDYVPKTIDMKDFRSDYTGRICVIGTNLNKNKLRELFLKGRRQ